MSERSGSVGGSAGAAANGTANGARGRELPRDPAALERLIDERRERLAATVDELARRARPGELARRGAQDAGGRLRSAVYTPDGGLRVERVAAVGAAVLALVVLAAWRRRSR